MKPEDPKKPKKRRRPKPEQWDLFGGPTTRQTDPETSWEAARSFSPERLSEIQRDVEAAFRMMYGVKDGRRTDTGRKTTCLTDEWLHDLLRDKYKVYSTVRKRRCELVQKGILRWSGQWAWNRNDRRMRLWEWIPPEEREPNAIPDNDTPSLDDSVPQLSLSLRDRDD